MELNVDSEARLPNGPQPFFGLLGELLWDSAPIAILILDSEQRIRDANAEAVRSFGYSKDQMLGQPISLLVPESVRNEHSGDIPRFFERPAEKVIGDGRVAQVRHQGGHEFPAEILLGPIFHDGHPTTVCMIRNVAHRLVTQQRIEHAERQVHVITDALPVLIAQVDRKARFSFVNAEFERAYGKEKDWFLGRPVEELISAPVFRELLDDLAWTEAKRRSAVEVEVDFPAAGRRTLSVEVIREVGDDGRVEGYYALASDVTNQRQVEATLRLHSQVLAHVHDAVVSTDLDGFVTSWNQGARRIFGYTEEEAIGRHIRFVYAEADRAYLEQDIIGPLKANGSLEAEVRMVRRNGEIFFANLSLSLLRDADNQAIGMIGYSADVTERKMAETALAESNQQLSDTLESISDAFYALDEQWRFTYLNSKALEIADRPAEEMLGEEIWTVFPNIIGTDLEGTFRKAKDEQEAAELERYYSELDRWYELRVYPSGSGLSVFSTDINERKRFGQELASRLNQQAAVAELGKLAVSGLSFRDLADKATAQLAETLDVEYTKVLELLPGGEDLLLLAGVGWKEGYVGRACVPADVSTQAGHTLVTSSPVIVTDFGSEQRFGCPDLLREHDVVSGMSVVIKTDDGPFGILGAHTLHHRVFTHDDIHFLESIANILAEAHRSRTLLDKLQESNEQLELISQRLVHAQETERKRIVHELHDQIGQSLTAVKIGLQALQRPGAQQRLDQMITENTEVIDRAIEKVRTLSFNLHPAILDDLGLVPTLRWYLDQQAEVGGFRANLTADPPDVTLDPFIEVNCFRIVQEAVTNIHRHAGAGLVEVILGVADGRAELRIKDDGAGFNPAEALERSREVTSLGLSGMRERALLMGGELAIDSEPGKGAEIILSFPISE